MQDKVEGIVANFKKFASTDGDGLTKSAQEIAALSLATFTGELLQRGLDIAKAVVEFSCELNTRDGNALY